MKVRIAIWSRIHNASISSQLKNGPDKLVFHNNELERLVRDKHFSLLGPFKSCNENEVLSI